MAKITETKPVANEHSGASFSDNGYLNDYISQIKAGDKTYDIATHHGIKFRNGEADSTGTIWNGITDLEVVIPTIADLVSSPVQFVGTVGSDGTITSISDDIDVTKPKAGYLVFITANCTFGGKVCESGDMAVYGTTWYVVSGEDQVKILANTDESGIANVVLTADVKDVLFVEGKTLKLSIDYTGVKGVLSVNKNATTTVESSGKATVGSKYITLTKNEDTTETIGVKHTINVPTALANGVVNFGNDAHKLFKDGDIVFTQGTLPTPQINTSLIEINASASAQTVTVTDSTDGKVLTNVDLNNAGDYVTDINVGDDDTKVFLTGWHKKKTEGDEATAVADFKFVESASLTGQTTFYKSLSDATAAGDNILVSNITSGDATGTFVTGLYNGETAVTSVVTNITGGSIGVDTNKTDFLYGLGTESGKEYDVLTYCELIGGTLSGGQNTNVFSSATVTDHVLSFGTSSVVSSIGTYIEPTLSAKGKKFTKAGVSYTAPTVTKATVKTDKVKYIEPTVSYRKLDTGKVDIDVVTGEYIWDTKKANKYTTNKAALSLTPTKANITVDTATITATIPENTVVTGFADAGTLSNLTYKPSYTLSATVDTSLTTEENKFYIVGESAKSITIPGTYTLGGSTTKPTDGTTAIEVGESGEIDVNASGTIPANTFITDVNVNDTTVSVKQ